MLLELSTKQLRDGKCASLQDHMLPQGIVNQKYTVKAVQLPPQIRGLERQYIFW